MKDKNPEDLKKMAQILRQFEKNVKRLDIISDEFRGKFVAIVQEKVVASSPDYYTLRGMIPEEILNNQELYQEMYIGYVPRNDEAFILPR